MDASLRQPIDSSFALPAALRGLRVALVHDWITGRRGGEKCLEVLCEAFPQATLHTLVYARGQAGAIIDRMRVRPSVLQFLPGVARYYRALLPVMPTAARTWDVGDVDLVVSFSHCVAKGVRVPRGVPHVCYCFTPMRYAWSGRAAYLEGWRDRPLRRYLAGAVLDRMQAWDRASSRVVTHFIAISEAVRERIRASYGLESSLIYPPVDVDFYTPSGQPREDFYLVVSALVPYKRVEQAVAACRALGRRLVVIGSGPERARLEALAGPGAQFLGWQTDEAVRDHLRRCRGLLFPGEEDFGIVPVEALACGAPVIALRAGGAVETVTPAVGELYDEAGATGLERAIRRFESRSGDIEPCLARAHAERFGRERFREELLRALAGVMRDARQSPTGLRGPVAWQVMAKGARQERSGL